MTQSALERAQAGISEWQIAFNNQDAAGCAAQYTEDCIMVAKPFGTFEGREAIQGFGKTSWTKASIASITPTLSGKKTAKMATFLRQIGR